MWALRDVSFDVHQGDVLGIIGHNGAGKSTLLKILSRITEPSEGEVLIRGRVAALLEVGTGFHPELTGRENIYMNGTILGMRKKEVDQKLDEIVAFSGVEKYLDTPVKFYSSGMRVRLGFSVAAHLEPEILIIDEVLSVGDAEFQKKCLGKMEDVSKNGRTVLFVSHNLKSVQNLCTSAILIENGSVVMNDEVDRVISRYIGSKDKIGNSKEFDESSLPGNDFARLKSVRVMNEKGESISRILTSESVKIEIQYWDLNKDFFNAAILYFKNENEDIIFLTSEFTNKAWKTFHIQNRLIKATCVVPSHLFNIGTIKIAVEIGNYNPNMVHVLVDNIVQFEVILDPNGEFYTGKWPGIIKPRLKWEIE